MRLFVTPFAPNALRVQILALEKGIALELVDVSESQRGDYLSRNPLGQVPALETGGGELITESLTICQYLDALSGPPFLFGETIDDRVRIGMWERRAELQLFIPSIEYGHHMHPMFAGRLEQHPQWARTLPPKALRMVDIMAEQLVRTEFLAGDALSAADFTAALGYFGLVAYGAIAPSGEASINRWSQAMMARPSMAPLHAAAQFLDSINRPQGAAA